MTIKGQITAKEVERLKWLASQMHKHSLIVEIGAYMGKSTVALASGMPETCHLVSIDPWVLGPQSKPDQGYETIETLLTYRENIKPYEQNITQIIGWPYNIAKWWGGDIDLLFVDATKRYSSILSIWKAFFPHCVGRVASHDYVTDKTSDQYYPGVHRALQEVVFPYVTDEQHHVDFTWDGVVDK